MFNYGRNTIKHVIRFAFTHCTKPKERIKRIIIIIIIIIFTEKAVALPERGGFLREYTNLLFDKIFANN